MRLSEIKQILPTLSKVEFYLDNGSKVPAHFHITEVGMITKHFIDCGGTVRIEKVVNFQLWNANDVDHRLEPSKLLSIIRLSEEKLGIEDQEIEVEYQGETIGKYGLSFFNGLFLLTSTSTNCLAQDKCGIPEAELVKNTCTPGGGCC